MGRKNAEHTFNKNIIWYMVSAAAGAFAAFLVLLGTSKFGPGISADSVAYMYAARSLAEGKGYVYFGFNAPFIQWPPLYPSLLAIAELFGLDIAPAANYLNAFILGLVIFITGMWLLSNVRNKVFVLWGLGALVFSVPLLYVSRYVWSEPLFILFLLLFIIETEKYLKTQRLSLLLLSAIFAALACITRYIGVVLILIGVAVIIFRRKKIVDRLYHMLAFGFISGLPLGIWAVRNYILSGTLFGARTPSIRSLKENMVLTVKTLASWVVPLDGIDASLGDMAVKMLKMAFAFIFIVFIVLLIIAALRNRKICGTESITFSVLATPVLFTMFYVVYLVGTATAVAFDSIDNRLLSPVFVPLIMTAATILDMVTNYFNQESRQQGNHIEDNINKKSLHTDKAARHTKKAISFILTALAVLWLVFPATSTVSGMKHLLENGAGGFNTVRWHGSGMIKMLREMPLEGNIYSNCPDAIYALAHKPACYTPRKNSLQIYGLERFDKAVRSSEANYIVWFDKYGAGPNYSIEELSGHYKLEKVAETEEGSIYRLYVN